MKKERLYRVSFDTQRDRNYITWGFYVLAYNQSDAIAVACERWHSESNPHYKSRHRDRPHMFHVSAVRSDTSPVNAKGEDIDIITFYIIDSRYAHWGYRG